MDVEVFSHLEVALDDALKLRNLMIQMLSSIKQQAGLIFSFSYTILNN